jgi:hypothetical protein
MKLYKFLQENNTSQYQNCVWSLPTKNDDGTWTPGEWMPEIEGKLVLCGNGYHLTDAKHLLGWRDAQLFEAEYRGDILEGNDKVAVRCARLLCKVEGWNDKNMRLYAVWCAREALKLVDSPDPRSINACDVAEKYGNGEATYKELAAARAAAMDAAWAAARDTARDAAMAAARDAQYKKLWEMIGITKEDENV